MSDRDSKGPSGEGDRKATIMMGSPESSPGPTSEPEPSSPGPASIPEPPRSSGGTILIDARESKPEPDRTSRGTLLMDPPAAGTKRPSRSRPTPTRRSRTTLLEVSQIAERLSTAQRQAKPDEPKIAKQMVLSFVVSLTLVSLATMVFAGGAWRLVLGILAATTGTTLAVWGTLRSLPRLAKWLGPRELPGSAFMWIGGFVVLASAATIGLTYSLSVVTEPLSVSNLPDLPEVESEESEPSDEPDEPTRADEDMKRGLHVGVGDGVLFVPPDFTSEDGRFDLLVHYHGNTELIEESVTAVKLNALVYIINRGEGSGRYSEPLRNPHAFDEMLGTLEDRAEEKLGLKSPRIRRIALSSWSAGYGAVYHILNSRSRLDRVDAVLMMDSLHASFAPGSETRLAPLSLKPFVKFGKRAIAGEKLMMITHTAVETHGYPDTTRSADGLLERLELEREEAAPEVDSPPTTDLASALAAFPSKEREWMHVTSKAERGTFLVWGCKGDDKGDHIAHLAQMSVTVLPPLVKRWKRE